MNNQEEVGTGENPYVPSARKSIHNHDRSIFGTCSDMGRYGLASKRELNPASSPSNLDQGTDEVDNVMSKFDRQSSPIPVRQKKSLRKDRRNSLNISDPEFSDDDESDSNLLAKSLPANLPSYYCSNDLSHKSGDFLQAHNTNSFSDSRKTLKTTSNEYNYGYNSTSTSFEESFKNHEDKQVQKSCVQIICSLFVAVLSIIAAMYYYGLLNQETSSNYDKSKFNKDMSDLGEKYKINEDSILEVQSGISTILEKNDTGSFIFIYNGQSMNFDHFVQEIASTAARYLRNDSMHSQPQPTVLHSSDLDMNSHSDLMKQYEYKVAKSGVMVVKDVDRIPSSLAMAFHYFCDEFSPLVAKSAIFFTLNLDNCSEYAASAQKFRHKHVEKCLANIWKMMPKENIQPLLARIVNVVIDVTDVF